MAKIKIFLIIMLEALFIPYLSVFAQSNTNAEIIQNFHFANLLYKDNKYAKAIEEYNKIPAKGFESGYLYYNLAGSCFKNGQLGLARLNYERAGFFIPNDSDLKSNYEYTISLLNLSPEEVSLSFFLKWIAKLSQGFSINALTLLLSFLYTVFFAILILRIFIRRIKRFDALLLTVVIALFTLTALALNRKIDYLNNGAIVINKGLDAKFEPFDSATTYFTLTEGAKIKVIDATNNWYKIKRGDEKIGWVNKSGVEMLSPPKTN
jgi:tetratricopeptide (TPR) repeat protein